MLIDRYREGAYLNKVPDWHAGDSPWKADKVLRMLEKHGLAPRTVCDIGCGAGEILVELQKKMGPDIQFTGYDISPQAIAICKPKENTTLRFQECDVAKSGDKADSFDLVLLLDVFEHVPDYLGFLQSVTGRAKWFVFHIPLDLAVESMLRGSRHLMFMRETFGHLHFFTQETALATLADTGYSVVNYTFTFDGEISGMGKMPVGLKAKLWHAIRSIRFLLVKLTYRINPSLAARLFKGFNLLVLTEGTKDE